MKIYYRLIVLIISFIWSFFITTSLIDITQLCSTIKTSLVYATSENFTRQQIYSKNARCYLIESAAIALQNVQKDLIKDGLGLLIWDAYRPLSAQKKLWEICPDERYVSDPRKGGRHTRGTAVDLTIVRLVDGKLLSMGTKHDDFSEKAHYNCLALSVEEKKNRVKLRTLMIVHGFEPFDNEWWHFDFKGWQNYPVLDMPL